MPEEREPEDLTVERMRPPVFPEEESPYEMTITEVSNFERQRFNSPDFETVLRIVFKSKYDPENVGKPWEFTWFVRKSLSPRSNLYKLAKAALGTKFDEKADTFDAKELIDEKVRLVLKTQTSMMGREYSKVGDVLPAKKKSEK